MNDNWVGYRVSMKLIRVAAWTICGWVVVGAALSGMQGGPARSSVAIRRPMLDAHNCYPYEGLFADRLTRALATRQVPIGIEQDLVWKPDERGGGTSVVAHDPKLVGGEPTLEDHFFRAMAPQLDAALKTGDSASWPLIVLHFDFKTNEPEHHKFVAALLTKYARWMSTTVRGSDDRPQPIRSGPLLVLTEAGENQERDFYDTLPVGAPMLIFGTVPPVVLTRSTDREVRADAAIGATPTTLLPSGSTNYRRWANFSWAVVERGGAPRAGDWHADDVRRLQAIVARAHDLGLWVRFYTLDGFSTDMNQGWSADYNFGAIDAARARWRAAIAAGVDLIATDQYEAFAAELSRPAARQPENAAANPGSARVTMSSLAVSEIRK